jgi:hypothetical protein
MSEGNWFADLITGGVHGEIVIARAGAPDEAARKAVKGGARGLENRTYRGETPPMNGLPTCRARTAGPLRRSCSDSRTVSRRVLAASLPDERCWVSNNRQSYRHRLVFPNPSTLPTYRSHGSVCLVTKRFTHSSWNRLRFVTLGSL